MSTETAPAITEAMLDAGEQAMGAYWTTERLASYEEGDGTAGKHARAQMREVYLAMRRLETGPDAEGLK